MSGLRTQSPGFPPSSLLQYLPAIYREDPFLGRFLLAFEEVLLGLADTVKLEGRRPTALERIVAGMPAYWIPRAVNNDPLLPAPVYDLPRQAPEEFLPWLASWTAFTLRFDLDKVRQREFIARVIPLYRRRGTKANLVEMFKIFTGIEPTVTEADDTPHFFTVAVRLTSREPAVVMRQIAIAGALVELEKPAHTAYELRPEFVGIQIGFQSTVGKDTLVGTAL
jgi:P2-related tail formation protein